MIEPNALEPMPQQRIGKQRPDVANAKRSSDNANGSPREPAATTPARMIEPHALEPTPDMMKPGHDDRNAKPPEPLPLLTRNNRPNVAR